MLNSIDILMVDDTLADLKLITPFLQAAGYQPRIAPNGSTAMRLVEMQLPDLILLDIKLPDVDGYQLCQQIQAAVSPHTIPVIFLSALNQTANKVKAFQVGGVDYITKPYAAEELLARIQLHLNHQQLHRNIKQQNQILLAQEQRWQLLLQGTQDGVWEWNHTGKVNVSAQYQAMLGYEAKSRTGSMVELWSSLLHPEDRDRAVSLFQAYLERKCPTYHIEFRLCCQDGSYKWILSRGQGIWDQDGKPLQVIGIHQDISDRKQAELELQQAREVAEAASRAKSEFLATMSHELRTPLTAILGFSEMLANDTNLLKEQRQSLKAILRSGEHLLCVINDILDLAKIEAGKIELIPKPFNLHDLLEVVLDILQVKVRCKNLTLTLEIAPQVPKMVETDEAKLRQILINLLGNAIKFTDTGYIILRISSLIKDTSQADSSTLTRLQFEIQDSGCGINSQELEKIFEAFGQGKAGQTATEGSGLGLTICQRYIQLMKGNIEIHSTVGMGTTVRFDLPVQVLETNKDDEISICPNLSAIQLAPDQPTYRILVAEDNQVNRRLLVQLLQQVGFETLEAENGQQAFDLWQHHQPQLILMNLQMPILNGDEAVEQIRCHPGGQAVVILALTASAIKINHNVQLLEGFNEIIIKPIRQQLLLEKIANHLGVRYLCLEEAATLKSPQPLNESLTPECLSVMPQSWIEQLHYHAGISSLSQISQTVAEIPAAHSQLRQQLEQLLSEFRMDKIYEVTQTVLENRFL